jgi:ribosomal protein S18 acetylase RimI-like enzyme
LPLFIRPAAPKDRQALFTICLVTANASADATHLYSDPEMPGLVWSVPYLEFSPDHCFVVDDGGEAVGFIVGTPDTIAFDQRLKADWWPALRQRYAGREPSAPHDHRVLDYIRAPQTSDPVIVGPYPAHLHINLLAPARSGGWGRRLIEAELASLRAVGASGVHLGVGDTNLNAIGFYRHFGFTEIERHPGGITFAMKL